MENYLVVGASSGIGKALANLLAEEGHRVYATYCNNETVSSHPQITYHQLDVLEDQYNLDFLPDTLNGVIYCVGSINLLPFARIKPQDFVNDYQLQVIGATKILQASLTKLKKSKNASVVLFSTVAVQTGFPFHAQVAASKGAIEGLTKALAAELSPVIRVNAIAPSITDTPLAGKLLSTEDKKQANANRHPLKQIGSAENLAECAAFLLRKATWMTGQIVHIDGGVSTLKV
ncbi:MAG: SDR family oxidoreductase [Cytophagales bacterium]|nr:SDR family oxidoreductase [Cytophagales bacterium]